MEDTDKKFVNTVIALAKLLYLLQDAFLIRKLYKKVNDFITGYVRFLAGKNAKGDSEQEANVAQSVACQELLSAIHSLLELTEYLEHYKAIDTAPLLLARRNILFIKLDLIKFANNAKLNKPGKKMNQFVDAPGNLPQNLPANIYSESNDKKLSVNKERIVGFIKKFPSVRTKDIIEEFSILSSRTVKRNLSELTQGGFLHKFTKDKAVFYSRP